MLPRAHSLIIALLALTLVNAAPTDLDGHSKPMVKDSEVHQAGSTGALQTPPRGALKKHHHKHAPGGTFSGYERPHAHKKELSKHHHHLALEVEFSRHHERHVPGGTSSGHKHKHAHEKAFSKHNPHASVDEFPGHTGRHTPEGAFSEHKRQHAHKHQHGPGKTLPKSDDRRAPEDTFSGRNHRHAPGGTSSEHDRQHVHKHQHGPGKTLPKDDDRRAPEDTPGRNHRHAPGGAPPEHDRQRVHKHQHGPGKTLPKDDDRPAPEDKFSSRKYRHAHLERNHRYDSPDTPSGDKSRHAGPGHNRQHVRVKHDRKKAPGKKLGDDDRHAPEEKISGPNRHTHLRHNHRHNLPDAPSGEKGRPAPENALPGHSHEHTPAGAAPKPNHQHTPLGTPLIDHHDQTAPKPKKPEVHQTATPPAAVKGEQKKPAIEQKRHRRRPRRHFTFDDFMHAWMGHRARH